MFQVLDQPCIETEEMNRENSDCRYLHGSNLIETFHEVEFSSETKYTG